MQAAIDLFRANLARIHDLSTLRHVISFQTTAALDLSDILRAELVLAVSAFDHYVHEVVRLGMLETFRRDRVPTEAFERFTVSMSTVLSGVTEARLEEEIRAQHGWRSFQRATNVADAVRLISREPLWERVGHQLVMTDRDVRTQLDLIVDRRNKIAHEADLNPTFPGLRWPISEALVRDAVDFIGRVAEAIQTVVL